MIKKLWILLFVSSPCLAVPPVILPSTPIASARGTVQFSCTDSVTWSLSPGSTGTINSATGLYTAPNTLTSKNVISGCPALPNDHIYNTRVDALPVDANSGTRIGHMLSGTTTHIDFEVSFPANVMNNATPTTTMNFFYTTERNNAAFPILAFPYAGIENAATPNNYFSQDRHQLGVNTDTCQFFEIYNNYPTGTNGGNPSANAQSGVSYYGMSYLLPDAGSGGGSTDAAGMYVDPLAIRYSELKSGVIKHALRFTLDNGDIQSAFIWPATQNATPGCTPTGQCFPYGARLRLKSSFQIGSYSKTAQVILTALKQYGMFMADGGTAMHIQTAADVSADTTTFAVLHNEIPQVSTITQNDFEQVDESTLADSTFTGHVNLSNAFVTPDNYANVIATRISDSITSTVTVAIQPVTVGVKNPAFQANSAGIQVMAGTPQFQIPYILNGTTNTTVTCSMAPTIGTITSGCLYTAPVSQANSISSATVKITPQNDPQQAFSFPLVVFSTDGIRVRTGPKSAANAPAPPYNTAGDYGPDSKGNYWFADPTGTVLPWYSRDDNYFPQGSWGSSPDIALFYTALHGNSDGAYSAMVPNGKYTLSIGFGTSDSGGVANSSASIDSQGTVLLSTTSVEHTVYTPNTLNYQVNVTNNQFYFSIREVVASAFTTISKWSLIPIIPQTISEKWGGNAKIRGGGNLR